MNLIVVGAGYVGLTAAAVFAERGNVVSVLEKDSARLALLRAGKAPFREPGLEALIDRGLSSERLRFHPTAAAALRNETVDRAAPLIAFLAVGTPADEQGGTNEAELHVVARDLGAAALAAGISELILVIKSTAPTGAAGRTADAARATSGTTTVRVVVNPEFLRAGFAVQDFMQPDRVVVGGSDPSSVGRVVALYADFVPADRILVMREASAALVKYAANAMLATRVSFMNEMANLASELGADIEEVRLGVGSDPRIGGEYLHAGIGYGGSCLPKDLSSLIAAGAAHGVEMGVARAVELANERQSGKLFSMLSQRMGNLQGCRIAVWGLSFKGGTDDLRRSPGIRLANELLAAGARVAAYEPSRPDEQLVRKHLMGDVDITSSSAEALRGADALAITADWPEFRAVAPSEIDAALNRKIVFDGRNLFDPVEMRSAGIEYFGIGRGEAP
jgi:UDPglucose 6-dehydrogenase